MGVKQSRCSEKQSIGFFMHEVAETVDERLDACWPDAFRHQITARAIKA